MEILPSYHFVHHNVHLDSSDIKLGPPYRISHGMACYTVSKFWCRFLHIYYESIPFFLPMMQQPLSGQGLLIIAVSRSHSGTPQSIGLFISFLRNSSQWAMASSFTRFLDHTQRRTTDGRTLLDEWSVHRRDLYLTTHNTNSRKTSTPPAGFETTIPASKRRQTHPLDRAAIGIDTTAWLRKRNNVYLNPKQE